jgi:hypothetical protein
LPLPYTSQPRFEIAVFEFSSSFVDQEILETLFLFMKILLLHAPTRKMPNLLDTCKMYIEYIEEVSFCGLTI